MGKVVVTMFITLDGVIEDPGPAGPFKFAGWSMPYWSDQIGEFKNAELFATDAHLLGRVTYEGFAAAWPTRKDEAGFADRMNSLPKYVVSTTLKKADWNNSTIIKGKVPAEVSKLKQGVQQDILVAGSATLVRSLMEADLVDEYRLLTYPIVLGSGKRLFKDGTKANLKLTESKGFSSGVVLLRYLPEKK